MIAAKTMPIMPDIVSDTLGQTVDDGSFVDGQRHEEGIGCVVKLAGFLNDGTATNSLTG